MRVKLTTIDEMLGSQPNDKEIHRTYIASKSPDATTIEEEVAAVGVDAVDEKGTTVFPRDKDGNLIVYNYQIKGFFKSACSALRKVPKTKSSKCKAYKKLIDLNIFVYADENDVSNRMVPINYDGEIGTCQRTLRAQTMQGERISLASSEMIGAGATIEFDVVCLNKDDEELVKEWLDYGRYNGLGQWRNSGKGAFVWEEL